MRGKLLIAGLAAIGFSVLAASARGEPFSPAASKPKKIGYSATLTLSPLPGSTNTACNIGYSSFCGSGNCKCKMYSGTGSSAVFGTASSVTLALTADLGGTTTGNSCFPASANVSIPGSKDTETIDVSATLCDTIDGGLQLTGGFQFRELSSGGLTATGTVTVAAQTNSPSKFQMKLKGKAVAP